MTFAHPLLLWLLLVLPPAMWWWLRRRRAALTFPDVRPLDGLPPGRGRSAKIGGIVLRGIGLGLLVLAAAGPRWPDQRTRLPSESIAIVLLVDVSGSMAERDYVWQGQSISRLEAVKVAFRRFVVGGDVPGGESLPGRANDLLGLVTFAARPEGICPLTFGHATLLQMLDTEEPRRVPGESETNVSDALVVGLHRLEAGGTRRRVLILLSDGEHNVPAPPSGWTPRQAAQIAANLGVAVHTIDAGGEPSPDPASGDSGSGNRAEGARTLREVAQITGGQSFRAHDAASLLEVCKKIDALERSVVTTFYYRRYHEGYPWFGLAAFVAWALLFILERTVWLRIP